MAAFSEKGHVCKGAPHVLGAEGRRHALAHRLPVLVCVPRQHVCAHQKLQTQVAINIYQSARAQSWCIQASPGSSIVVTFWVTSHDHRCWFVGSMTGVDAQ